jgi:molybdopterin-binding protein
MSITAINVRNQFRGKVREVIEGPVVSEVDEETASGQIVTSVITTRSVKGLGLVPGRQVIALVQQRHRPLDERRRRAPLGRALGCPPGEPGRRGPHQYRGRLRPARF